jgi:hypothetical protein
MTKLEVRMTIEIRSAKLEIRHREICHPVLRLLVLCLGPRTKD